ncbi:MAG: hypothetical protein COA50_15330 [Flavobacteriaceae bacterium]|nr:MAG: hypothetical protein COA50_15330 [Flavobacteriaceae bacterium]
MKVYRKVDVDKVQDNIISVINPSKRIIDLEKKLKFSETFGNQVALADAYLESEMYDKAIENYEASLKDVFKNDFHVISKLVEAHYSHSQFDKAIAYAEKIKDNAKFKKSKGAFLYGLALEKKGHIQLSEEQLVQFDAPFSRYQERLVLGQFYIRNKKDKEAKTILQEIVDESKRLSKQGYSTNRIIIKKAEEILATLA